MCLPCPFQPSSPSEVKAAGFGPTGVRAKFRVSNLSLWYGSQQALFDVSVTIPERSVVALIGPSGCGKSTFLRTLNRMNDLIENVRHEGHVLLDGEEIYARQMDLVDLRRRVGMVFQKPNPFPKSVFENVVYGPRVAGVGNKSRLYEIAERCLRRAALWDEVKDRLNDSALNLSGGQQHAVHRPAPWPPIPRCCLLDEPAAPTRLHRRIEDLVFELSRDYSIVIVTHNSKQARGISTHCLLLPGPPHRDRPHRPDLHPSAREADGRLHHRD